MREGEVIFWGRERDRRKEGDIWIRELKERYSEGETREDIFCKDNFRQCFDINMLHASRLFIYT